MSWSLAGRTTFCSGLFYNRLALYLIHLFMGITRHGNGLMGDVITYANVLVCLELWLYQCSYCIYPFLRFKACFNHSGLIDRC